MQVTGQQRSTPRLDELTVRVRGEYREMPGLSLTVPQAQRLWGLERATCQALFEQLVETRFLRRTRHGRFVRWEVSSPITPTW
jgi:Fic family protein